MIKLLTKKKYYSILNRDSYIDEEYNIFDNFSLNLDTDYKYFYLEDYKIPFVSLKGFNKILINKIYKAQDNIIECIKNSEVSFSNWNITFLGEETERKYILNTYMRGDYLEKHIDEGKYKLTNLDFSEETLEFSVITNKREKYKFYDKSYFAFDKKTDPDISIDEINLLTKIIITAIEHGSRGNS